MDSVAERLRHSARALLRRSACAMPAPTLSIAFSLPLPFPLPLRERPAAGAAPLSQPALATLQFSLSGAWRAPEISALRALPPRRLGRETAPPQSGKRWPASTLRRRAAAHALALIRRAPPLMPAAAAPVALLGWPPANRKRLPAPLLPAAAERRLPASGRARLPAAGSAASLSAGLPRNARAAGAAGFARSRQGRPARGLGRVAARCRAAFSAWLLPQGGSLGARAGK